MTGIKTVKKEDWENNDNVKTCGACRCEFGLFTRKHHCRACGKIFCDNCTDDKLSFEDGSQRACYQCFVDLSKPADSEIENMILLRKQFNQVERFVQKIILCDNKNRHKGLLFIGDSMIIVSQLNSTKTILESHLINLMELSHDVNSRIISLQFGLFLKNFKVIIESSHCKEIIHAIRQSHFDLISNPTRQLKINIPDDYVLPLNIIQKSQKEIFYSHYTSLASLFNVSASIEVLHFIEGLIYDNNVEINFNDCPDIEIDSPMPFDIKCFVQSLSFNSYFRSIVIEDIQQKELISELCSMLTKNSFITRLSIHSSSSSLTKLGNAIIDNETNAITDLILSDINLSKSISSIETAIANMKHGLRIIKLPNCSLQSKQIKSLIQHGIMLNYPLALTIQELDLSNNRIDDSGSKQLSTLFTKIGPYSDLRKLNLQKCNINWSIIAPSIKSLNRLEELDISYSSLNESGVQLLCTVIEGCFPTLSSLKLAGCNLHTSGFENISRTIAARNIPGFCLDVSENSLKESSIQTLLRPFQNTNVLHTLDLTGCKLNASLINFLFSVIKDMGDFGLDTLILNQAKLDSLMMNQKTGYSIYTSIYECLQVNKSIKSLSLCGGYSNHILLPLLEGLQENDSLLELCISGNKIGDTGACCIAKLLRNNKSLVSLHCDDNGISISGFNAIALSIKQSNVIQYFGIPWNDMTSNIPKGKKFKNTGQLLLAIHDKMIQNRNASPLPRFQTSKNLPIIMEVIPLPEVPEALVQEMYENKGELPKYVPPENNDDEVPNEPPPEYSKHIEENKDHSEEEIEKEELSKEDDNNINQDNETTIILEKQEEEHNEHKEEKEEKIEEEISYPELDEEKEKIDTEKEIKDTDESNEDETKPTIDLEKHDEIDNTHNE